jgi:predicted dehydrogenase
LKSAERGVQITVRARLAYHRLNGFEICGIVTRSAESRAALNAELGGEYPEFSDFYEALRSTRPDAVSISTYPETHGPFAEAAFDAGCHVFIEKPLAGRETVPMWMGTRRLRACGFIMPA